MPKFEILIAICLFVLFIKFARLVYQIHTARTDQPKQTDDAIQEPHDAVR